ncbi:MAG: MGMT family protein [SAR324 cluster bacterium]|nr:MGMT family protein [SAR324 cluster bacterium]
MRRKELNEISVYQKVYEIVRQIPHGKVASYGQIAGMLEGCTARMVGYAMAATPEGSDIPWQRVINSQGKISPRSSGDGGILQYELLKVEGIRFDQRKQIDWNKYAWKRNEID